MPNRIDLSSIRCIALDAVGTLIEATPPVAQVYARTANKYGSSLDQAEVARRLRGAFRQTRGVLGDPHATSEQVEWEFWQQVVRMALDDVTDHAACFEELHAWFGESQAWQCYAEVGDVILACRDRGFRLAIASNFDHRLERVIDGLPELSSLECRVISSQVGFRKPSMAFYRSLAEATECEPNEILMVGDDFQADVVGARAAGLSAIYLDRASDRVEQFAPTEDIPVIRDLRALVPQLAERVAK